jgi:hypothetical protein
MKDLRKRWTAAWSSAIMQDMSKKKKARRGALAFDDVREIAERDATGASGRHEAPH